MPPVDTERRRDFFKAYAYGTQCTIHCPCGCCCGVLVDIDRVGARLRLQDVEGASVLAPCDPVRVDFEGVDDYRLAGTFRCSVCARHGFDVEVRFHTPLNMGIWEMQRALTGSA